MLSVNSYVYMGILRASCNNDTVINSLSNSKVLIQSQRLTYPYSNQVQMGHRFG